MRRSRTRALTGFGILLVCCICSFALDPSLEISQYAHTSWKLRDGFTKGATFSIAQTPDGYLWLGTEFGLVRFDGVQATPWQPPRDQHLPPGSILCLLVARDGTLWIGARGLASWKNGKLTHYSELAEQYVFALREDAEGTVWAGTDARPYGRLCAIRDGTILCYGQDGTLGLGVTTLYEDSKGDLWAGVYEGLWRWKPGPPKFYSVPTDAQGMMAISEDVDRTLLIKWKNGIGRLIDGKSEPYRIPGISYKFQLERMLRDRNGGLWIGTWNHGLIHLHQGRTDVFTGNDGLSGDNVQTIFEDREGNIWVATVGGLDRFRDSAAATFTTKQGLTGNLVLSVLADKNGGIWLSTSAGLNRWEHGQITIPETGSGKRDGMLHGLAPESLFLDKHERTWVATSGELGYFENGQFTSIKGVPSGFKLSIAEDSAGNQWVVIEQSGLFRISPQDEVRSVQWSELGHKDHASVLAADPTRGGLWIGFFQGGIVYFSDGQVRQSYTSNDGLSAGRVNDFLFDNDGALWVSTEGGLSRLKNGHVATLTSKNGLPCDTVHWAMKDDDHSMWLYSACGLLKIPRWELDSWAAVVDGGRDPTQTLQLTVFDRSDGVRSLSHAGELHPQVAKTADGKLWFLPWDGVSVIDPHQILINNIPPPVHIEQIVADRKTYDTSSDAIGDLRLASPIRDLEIDYTALSLVAPDKNRFRYKLEGLDKDWHDAGNRRQAYYTDLSPHHYRFRVAACNNSGVWNEEGAALDFVIPPAWYQTNSFRGACIAAFLMMIWGIHELRVRQLVAQFNMRLEERVAERTRIARDLHDTLLQSFQGLLLQFKAISYRLQPGEIKKSLDAAIGEASQAITEGRDTVQGLRASILEKNDLAEAIRAFGEELASSAINQSPVAFEVVVEGRRKRKRPFLRDEIYRIAIEALRNAFRHAQADRIEVELQYDDKEFTLRVRDNGRGIDRDVLSSDGRKGHFGLHGMRERAKLIGGELAIWSEVESGTEVELSVPAGRAYTRPSRRSWFFRKFSRENTPGKEKVGS